MKKVIFMLLIILSPLAIFAQSEELEINKPFTEEELAEQTLIFNNAKKLHDEKKVQLEDMEKALKNTVMFNQSLKDIFELLEELRYSIIQKDLDKAQRLVKEVEKIDFTPMEKEIAQWEKLIEQSEPVYDKVKADYDRITETLLENRNLISDYEYKVFIGNIEYKNTPHILKAYRTASDTKTYEEIQQTINNVKEVDLVPLEKAIEKKLKDTKARLAEEKRIREYIPGKTEEIRTLLQFYQLELPSPGDASQIKKEFESIKRICDSTRDVNKADLYRLHELESDINSINFDYLENCLKALTRGYKILESLGIKISLDKGWSNAKQQRYYIDAVKDSYAESINLKGPLYFHVSKRDGVNDKFADFTDMSLTDFLVKLGNSSGSTFTFIVNRKTNKPVTIELPDIK